MDVIDLGYMPNVALGMEFFRRRNCRGLLLFLQALILPTGVSGNSSATEYRILASCRAKYTLSKRGNIQELFSIIIFISYSQAILEIFNWGI